MESLNSNSQEREMHQLQQMQDKAKEKCIESFRLLYSHLKVLSIKGGFERACVALFDQDNQTFTESLLLNLDNLEKQLDREEFQETESIGAFRVLMNQFQTFINFRYCFDDFEGAMICKSFLENTRTEIQQFRDTLIQHMESVKKTIDEEVHSIKRENNRKVTQHYLPKGRESAFAKPNHMIASSSSRNSSKNMPRFSSNDMVHNYYLKEAKKKTQERDRKSTTSVMPKADHSRNSSPFSDFKHFVCSTCQKCVFNANHDACITKFLKEVNSRAKIQPNKTRNSNKPVDPTSHTQKPDRKIVTGHSFSPNKSSAVHEKTNTPRSYLRWIPTGRIFNTAGLKWVPTGKTFTSSTTKVDCTLNLSAGTFCNPEKERLGVCLLKKVIYQKPRVPGIYAPLLKEKKSVRFSALYLQKKRNLLVS
ncbi:hypothetical protein Tco_0500673 [Tanacetum coccineum]